MTSRGREPHAPSPACFLGPHFFGPDDSQFFQTFNRNKRSIALDLKQPAARDACLELAKKSDVLVYNIRPQAMARLRLSYVEVCRANPRIIYAGCFGYSQRGPYAAKAAYDDMIQGASGLPWLLQKQGAAEPRYAPMIVADRSVGQQVAIAATLRQRSGRAPVHFIPLPRAYRHCPHSADFRSQPPGPRRTDHKRRRLRLLHVARRLHRCIRDQPPGRAVRSGRPVRRDAHAVRLDDPGRGGGGRRSRLTRRRGRAG